jgi:hypothetical protein
LTTPVQRFLPLALSFLAACGATSPSPQEVIDRTVYTFDQHVRWKRFDKASRFVSQAARDQFLKSFEGSEETLSIDDLEVKDINFDGPNKVTISVEARYYKLPSVTLQKKKWVQTWEKKGDDWWLEDNALGPFFPEAASKPASQPHG